MSHPIVMMGSMELSRVDEAIDLLEKANANLEPELLPAPLARRLLGAYARAQKLAAFGVTALARKLDDPSELARATGSWTGKAKDTIVTGKVLGDSAPLEDALKHGEVSLDQATEIAKPRNPPPVQPPSC